MAIKLLDSVEFADGFIIPSENLPPGGGGAPAGYALVAVLAQREAAGVDAGTITGGNPYPLDVRPLNTVIMNNTSLTDLQLLDPVTHILTPPGKLTYFNGRGQGCSCQFTACFLNGVSNGLRFAGSSGKAENSNGETFNSHLVAGADLRTGDTRFKMYQGGLTNVAGFGMGAARAYLADDGTYPETFAVLEIYQKD